MALVRWIVYSNLWVSLVAPSMLWSTSILMGKKLDESFYVFVFSATLFTYNIQRLYKATDFISNSVLYRHRWIWENRKALWLLTYLSGISTIVCLFFVPFQFLLWLLPAGIISAFYFIPFYRSGKKWKRLRDIPLLKIVLVSLVWAWVSVFCVAKMLGKPQVVWVPVFVFQFFFCFAVTVPFDIRDAEFDKAEGTKTFVSIWGANKAKWLSTVCFAISLAGLYFLDLPLLSFLTLILFFVLGCISVWFSSSSRHELYYGFWLDGLFIFQGPVTFFAVYIWTI
jgi:4-hydroxybenzoate polyprenyltransferase